MRAYTAKNLRGCNFQALAVRFDVRRCCSRRIRLRKLSGHRCRRRPLAADIHQMEEHRQFAAVAIARTTSLVMVQHGLHNGHPFPEPARSDRYGDAAHPVSVRLVTILKAGQTLRATDQKTSEPTFVVTLSQRSECSQQDE